MSDPKVTETFVTTQDQSDRLASISHKFDISKSRLVRCALDDYLSRIETMEPLLERGIIQRFLNQNTKPKAL